jgi:hypothetical protein
MRLSDRQVEVLLAASRGQVIWTQFTGGGKFIDREGRTISPTVESLVRKGLIHDVGVAVRMGGPAWRQAEVTQACREALLARGAW